MHYYKRDIGAYHKRAGKLSMVEHGAYTLILDACHDREVMPTLDEALDWCWARSEEEIDAVKFVLSKFFTLKDEKYVHDGVAEALDQYQKNSVTNKRIAQQRSVTKRERSVDEPSPSVNEPSRSVNEPSPNYELEINNQKLETRTAPSLNNRDCAQDALVSPPGKICAALKNLDCTGVNTGYQPLLKALREGAELHDFTEALDTAKARGKPTFPYVIGIVNSTIASAKFAHKNLTKSRARDDHIGRTIAGLTGRNKSAETPNHETLQPIATSSVEAVFTEFEMAYGTNYGRMWQHSSFDDVIPLLYQ